MIFHNPVKIINYPGCRKEIEAACSNLHILVFCSKAGINRFKKDNILNKILDSSFITFESDFEENPSLEDLQNIAKKHKEKKIDFIIGVGGGSAMDAAKISSVSIPASRNGHTINNLLDDLATLKSIKSINTLQVPTTAGTGSEVTPFATVWDYELEVKKSLSSETMYANTAYVDPDLLKQLPPEVAVSTGLDALNQAFESIWNKNANPITRNIAIEAIILNFKALSNMDTLATDSSVRENLASASLFAGLAISQTRTALCHSISYPLTLEFGLPHGLACAFSMKAVLAYNMNSIKKEMRAISSGLEGQDLNDLIDAVYSKNRIYEILRRYIPTKKSVMSLRKKMFTVGRADNNIVQLTDSDLIFILEQSCELAQIN